MSGDPGSSSKRQHEKRSLEPDSVSLDERNSTEITPLSMCTKKFIFSSAPRNRQSESTGTQFEGSDRIEVLIYERMNTSYGLYVWPSAPILAWYLYHHKDFIRGKKVLELGAGTALPGIVSALCGAEVTLSDSGKLPHCIEQSRKNVEANGLTGRVKIIGLTWGLFLNDLINLRGNFDIILGSDCFYDPSVFEELLLTIAYLLGNNRQAKFLGTYQERSSDWSIESLLKKWGLQCKHVPLDDLAETAKVDLAQLMQDHTVHLLEITLL